MILAHNLDRPIGVLVTHASGEAGLSGVFAIDATPDGDTAIAQARSGSRRGLSGGIDVDPDGVTETDDGGLTVTASRLAEVSQVVLGAYDGAAITQIAAQQTPQAEGSEMPDDVQPAQPALAPITTPDDAPPVAERRPVIVTAERDQPEMRLGEYVQTLVRAERGDRVARGRIEAQLSRGDLTTSPGVVPIVYVQTIIDSLGFDRPLFDAMDHAEMPAAGMTIRRPVITNRPDGGWLANDQAGAPTSPVAIGDHDEAVRQWAWGGSASVALVERSSPSYIEEVFSQAVKAYYRDVEADIAAEFPAATGGPATLGAAVAAYLAAYRSYPTLLVCGAQAYGSLLDATGVLMFTSGSATAAGGGTVAGLRAVASPDVAPADAWVTAGDFIECRESTPIRLSVSDVTSLSLEIGVTAFFASTQTRAAIGGVNGAVGIPGFTGGALAQPAKRESK
jgi:HK97 family phage prohead protease